MKVLYSPDYKGNPYQSLLYSDCRSRGHELSPLDCREVPERLDSEGSADGKPVIFHQHWLKEIFCRKGSLEEKREFIERYFTSIERFSRRGGKVVWTVHNLIDHDLDASTRLLNKECIERILRIANVVHVHAACNVPKLEQLIGHPLTNEVRLIPHPLYNYMERLPDFLPVEIRLGQPFDGLKFVMFGMQRPYKGGVDLLRAFRRLRNGGKIGNDSLVIAGSIHDPELRKELSAGATANLNVTIIDRRLTDSELASLCRWSDVCVLPYRKINISGSFYQAATFSKACIVPKIGMFGNEFSDGKDIIKYDAGDGVEQGLVRAHNMGRQGLATIGRNARNSCSGSDEIAIGRRIRRLFTSTTNAPLPHVTHDLNDGEDGIILSFCIPVMNRLSDLQSTLSRNLDDNRSSFGRVEFVVACFDQSDDTEEWVRSNFASDIASGYLRFFRLPPMPYWHFGIAKNAFKTLLRGKIYASLDGDNFTGPNGGEHIISVFEDHDFQCVFHQFQGEWGDGTCGRVSLSRNDYIQWGYDERFLPRQWDEMDAMLTPLVNNPRNRYVCYEGRSILKISHPFRRFLDDHGLIPRTVLLPPDSDPLMASETVKAVGCHENSYVQDDALLRLYSRYNHLQSYYKNTNDPDLRNEYVSELVDTHREMLTEIDIETLYNVVLEPVSTTPASLAPDDIPLLACLKDELDLAKWYLHYRKLGVTRFLIIDDGSKTPVAEVLPFEDVHVFKTKTGAFRYAKAFWLNILLGRFCENLWCVTVDGDEYLSLPDLASVDQKPHDSTLRIVAHDARNRGYDHVAGFLLDTIVAPGFARDELHERANYSFYQFSSDAPRESYVRHNTTRWGFGRHGHWAQNIDVRYRVNQSIDSLRKFPFFLYRNGTILNQGFHDLIFNGEKRSPDDMARPDLVPIVHYKLWVMLEKSANQVNDFSSYHHETRENLERLSNGLEFKIRSAANSGKTYPYLGYALIPVPGKSSITVRHNTDQDKKKITRDLCRESAFQFSAGSETVHVDGLTIHGPDFETTIAWLRTNTPFGELSEINEAGATLSTQHHFPSKEN